MTDIVERLRKENSCLPYYDVPKIQADAADEIDRLRAALRRWEQTGCPDCSGDCCAANIPISGCIMQETRAALGEKA